MFPPLESRAKQYHIHPQYYCTLYMGKIEDALRIWGPTCMVPNPLLGH